MNQNLFIIGPVASGKNTLLDNLKRKYNINVLDTGKLYRYLALCAIQRTTINPDYQKLFENDKQEETRIIQELYRWNRTFEESLNKLEIVDGKLVIEGQEVTDDKLYSKEVNSIISLVARSNLIRKRILNFINNDFGKRVGNYAMTGHNIKEIDTTQFTVIFLDITNEKAAERLYCRNPTSYKSIVEAYKEVVERNRKDGINLTKDLLPMLYNYIYIDTTDLSEEQVEEIVIREMQKIEKQNEKFNHLQNDKSISRREFEWIFNPFLEIIKAYLDRNLDRFLIDKNFISKTDLEYQVLIKMCSYPIEELFQGDIQLLRKINNGIENRNNDGMQNLIKEMIEGKVILNSSLIDDEIQNQINRLNDLYESISTKQIMAQLNSSDNGQTISLKDIVYRKVDRNISEFIAKNCHYLHTPREDEFISYGAFVKGEPLPIAWVSFSKQDREYKKQLLYYLGIEPQNTLEMTRAWCSNSAPQNIMSSLFQHAIDYANKEWKKLKKDGKVNKDLQAITTTINPNLGFKASSFLGCNFIPFALRPARFTYGKKENSMEYMTRREIESNGVEYYENQFNILPLNEIILCLDKRKQEQILKGKIYVMDKSNYDKILNEGEKDGKDIDSDEEQR